MSASSKIAIPLITVLLTAIMIKLGFWQLDRAQLKTQRQQIIDTRLNQDIRPVPGTLLEIADWQFYQVSVQGIFQSDLGFIVDNVVNNSMAGVNVVSPLKISGSDTLILVNRGWLAWGNDRTFLPVIETPQQVVNLKGVLIPASEDHFYLKDPQASGQDKQLWSQLDLQRFKQSTEFLVQPLILLLNQDQPGSYEYIGQFKTDNWIARHKAYAFQWFALALTLVIIMMALAYKRYIKQEQT